MNSFWEGCQSKCERVDLGGRGGDEWILRVFVGWDWPRRVAPDVVIF